MKNRSREIIIREILRTCKQPTKKTLIMYRAVLSYTQLKEYINHLFLERELLDYNSSTKTYVLSKEGKEYLRRLELI